MRHYIKQLLREGLLFEITSDDAWDKFYSDAKKFPKLNGDKSLFDEIESLCMIFSFKFLFSLIVTHS
jgi:hypothetical protein